MREYYLKLILILIFLIQPISSQTYVELFSKYLPQDYLEEEDRLEYAENSLRDFAKINPDLIYYYLSYLNLIAEQNVFNRDSNYYNILQYENSLSCIYNNEWVEEEKIRAEKLSLPGLMYQEVISLLDEFEVPELNVISYSIELETDTNMQKYFTYKCLTQDTNLTFDENINYRRLVEGTLEDMVLNLKLKYEAILSGDSYELSLILEELLQYHIFSKGFSDGHHRKFDFNITEYLSSLLNHSDYKEYSGILFGFGAEALYHTFKEEKIMEPYLPYEEITLKSTMDSIIFFNISAGYRVKLKDYKAAFSHLDISVGWCFKRSKISDFAHSMEVDKSIFIFEGRPPDYLYIFSGRIDSVSWNINKFSSFVSNIYLPVFYFNRNLFFEIGLQYRYIRSEYSIKVYRTIYQQSSVDSDILGPEIESLNLKTNTHLFGGNLTVNYLIINSLNIKCKISTIPSIQIGFDYLFEM